MVAEIAFIVNPNAGNGSSGKNWPALELLALKRLGSFTTYFTSGPGNARVLTVGAVQNGAQIIVCVGGDGTLNEVINGLMDLDESIRKQLKLGFIPSGTGCDFVRTVRIPKNADQALDIIVANQIRSIDIGRLRFQDHDGHESIRFFHNIASFGLGGEVDERVNRTTKAFGAFFSFIWATIISIFQYGKKEVRLTIDDTFEETTTIWNVAVANGQYHGGGMRVAPDASPTDGIFNITVVGDLRLDQVFLNLRHLYNGRIYSVKTVRHYTAKTVAAVSAQRVLLDVDGEQPGTLPAAIDIIPQALNLLAPD